jgi:hypothetical protein
MTSEIALDVGHDYITKGFTENKAHLVCPKPQATGLSSVSYDVARGFPN